MPKQRYEHRKVDPMRPLLPPERLWLSIDAVNHALKNYPKINFKAEKSAVICSAEKILVVSALPAVTIQSQAKRTVTHNFVSLLSILKEMFYFQLRLKDDVKPYWICVSPLKIKPKQIKTLSEANQDKFNLWVSRLEQGFILDEAKLAVITEHEILGERVQQRQRDKRKAVNPDTLVRNLAELKLGSPLYI